jgi:ArsR family transcriptional regulator, lead/cadmium/zinc/bismuth-responsive transcriptional repressor
MSNARPPGTGVAPLDRCAVRVVDAERVAATRERLPASAELEGLTGLFRLLGDATRARLLYALLEAGELCVCDLAASIDASQTTVSQALRLLRTAGIVRARRSGRTMHYRLDDEHVRLLLDLSREHLRHSDRAER